MAAPTDVRIIATQASATSTIQIGACDAGDLLVLVATGTQTAIGTAGTVDEDGSVGSGWTQDATVDGSGSARTRVWSKVLTSATTGAGPAVGPTSWTSNGTSRFSIFIFRHADGFDTTAANRLVGTATHNTNVTNGSSVASISGGVRKLVAISGVTYGSAQNALTVTWDGGSPQDPYVDESTTTSGGVHYGTGSGSCQADRNLYDTAGTVGLTYSTGLNNTTHAIATVVYKTKPVNYAASPSESVGVTDARTVGVTYVRTVSDTIGVTDSASRSGADARAQADQVALADAVAQVSAAASASNEPIGVTDTLVSSLTAARAPNDQVDLSDSVTYAISYASSIADNVGINDGASGSTGGGSTTTADINDAVGISDDRMSTSTIVRSLNDAVGVMDSLSVLSTINQTVSEAVGVVDSIYGQSSLTRSASDSVGLDSNVVDADTDAQTLNDQVGFVDSVSWAVTSSRSPNDAIGVLDSVDRSITTVRASNDSIGVTDSRNVSLVSPTAYTYTLSSTIGILDATVKVMSREILDYLVLTTNHLAYRVHTRTVADNVGLTDSMSRLVQYIKAFNSAASVGSTVSATQLSPIVRQIPVQKTTATDLVQVVDVTERLTQLIEIAEKLQSIELT